MKSKMLILFLVVSLAVGCAATEQKTDVFLFKHFGIKKFDEQFSSDEEVERRMKLDIEEEPEKDLSEH